MIDLHLTDELFNKLKRIKSYKLYSMALYVLKEGFVTAEEISKECGQGLNYMEDMFSKIEYLKIIQKQVDKDHNVYFTAHTDLVNKNFACTGCKHAKTVKHSLESSTVKITSCKLQAKEIECIHNGYRKLKALKIINRKRGIYENSTCLKKVVAKNGKVTLGKKLEDWTTHDFAEFYYIEFTTRFQKLLVNKSNKMVIKQHMHVLHAYFKEHYPDDANFYLRQYIDNQFTLAERGRRMTSLAIMAKVNNIRKFAKEEAVVRLKKCGKYKIYCPYWKQKECQAGVKCTKRLRSKIKKTYN